MFTKIYNHFHMKKHGYPSRGAIKQALANVYNSNFHRKGIVKWVSEDYADGFEIDVIAQRWDYTGDRVRQFLLKFYMDNK